MRINKSFLISSIIIILFFPISSGCIDNDRSKDNSQDNEKPIIEQPPENETPEIPGDPDKDNPDPDVNPNGTIEKDEKEFQINLSGYCYNPEIPYEGPSTIDNEIDMQDFINKDIKSTIHMKFYFWFEDDHFNYRSDTNTGDIFTINLSCDNITGEIIFNYCYSTFPGGSSSDIDLNCDIRGEGIYYDTVWRLVVSISNCGEYPKYGGPGIFTEPDNGNDWEASFEFLFILED